MADESTGGSHTPQPEQIGQAPEVITTPEGFRIHGQNETSLIRSLKSLNGIPVAQLEANMRPMSMSEEGLLGMGESLTEVLADDNDTVLGMGLTHQELADFIHTFDKAPGEMIGSLPEYATVEYNGQRFAHAVTQWRGIQESPFGDGTSTSRDHRVINLETGAEIRYSGLLPEMIHRYGFYEGKGTDYRLEPQRVAEVARFAPSSPDDPVVQLVRDRDASVEITTSEQLARVKNLASARVDVLSGQNYRIVPEDVETLLLSLRSASRLPYKRGKEEPEAQRMRREQIAVHVDTQRLTPQPYQMSSDGYTLLTEVIPSDFPQFEQAILQGIETIEFPEGEDSLEKSDVEQFLENTLKALAERDPEGKPHPHAEYLAGLLQRVKKTPENTLRIYDAAAKTYDPGYGAIRVKPEIDREKVRALADVLDATLPTLREDVIALCKQLRMPVSDDATLEQLLLSREGMENYRKAVSGAVEFAKRVGGLKEVSESDMGTLLRMVVSGVSEDQQYTDEESAALKRLGVDPSLIPYAFKAVGTARPSAGMVIAQLYNGTAKKERDLERTVAQLPAEMDEKAKAAAKTLIKGQLESYSSEKVDVIRELIARLNSQAEH